MTIQAPALKTQPHITLNAVNMVVELFNDRIVIRRTDTLTALLPDMFEETRIIKLDCVAAVYLLDSKYSYSRWLMLILQFNSHKHIVVLYNSKDQAQAVAIKKSIDCLINKRQPIPTARV